MNHKKDRCYYYKAVGADCEKLLIFNKLTAKVINFDRLNCSSAFNSLLLTELLR